MYRHRLAVLASTAVAVLAITATASATIAYQSASSGQLMTASDAAAGATRLGVKGTSPLISPDGTRVAYIGGTANRPQLRIRTIATGAEVVAAVEPGTSVGFGSEWAPDSAHLAVPTESATAKGYITGAGIDIVDAATGVATVVVAPKGNDLAGFSWAPTADRLVYGWQRYGAAFGTGSLRIAGLDGAQLATLGAGTNPLWGPRLIAFQRTTSARWHGMTVQHAQLWTIDPATPGAAATQLTHYASVGLVYGPFAAAWSPDGTTIFGGIGGEDMSLPGRISLATGRFANLRDGAGKPLYDAAVVAVSADGRTLLLDTGEMSGTSVYRTIPVGGGALRVYLKHAYNLSVQPSWQP